MANPALQRSGEVTEQDDEQTEEESAPGAFAGHGTADLIALRDRLLEDCLELETGDGTVSAGGDADPDDLRARIDEIHQELALRDLAERLGAPRRAAAAAAAPASRGQAHADEVSGNPAQILQAIEMRSRFLDELAHAARDQGRLDQAAAFTMDAQRLDMERVEVIRKLSVRPAGGTPPED